MGIDKIISMLENISTKEDISVDDIDRVYNFLYGYVYASTKMMDIGVTSSEKDLQNVIEEIAYIQGVLMGLNDKGRVGSDALYKSLIHMMDDCIGTAKNNIVKIKEV